MTGKISKFVFWTPRILSIIFILFLALFSLDVISSELELGQIIIGLFMHNIPSFILLIVLIISWKNEIVGGIVFLLFGFIYIIMTACSVPWHLALSRSLIIAGPAFVIGILFIINWVKKKQ